MLNILSKCVGFFSLQLKGVIYLRCSGGGLLVGCVDNGEDLGIFVFKRIVSSMRGDEMIIVGVEFWEVRILKYKGGSCIQGMSKVVGMKRNRY